MQSDALQLRIGHRRAGQGAPLVVVAEIGRDHHASVECALRLVGYGTADVA